MRQCNWTFAKLGFWRRVLADAALSAFRYSPSNPFRKTIRSIRRGEGIGKVSLPIVCWTAAFRFGRHSVGHPRVYILQKSGTQRNTEHPSVLNI